MTPQGDNKGVINDDPSVPDRIERCGDVRSGCAHPSARRAHSLGLRDLVGGLVAAEEVAGVDFVGDVGQFWHGAVGQDEVGALFETIQVVDDL